MGAEQAELLRNNRARSSSTFRTAHEGPPCTARSRTIKRSTSPTPSTDGKGNSSNHHHNSASVGRFANIGVGYVREVPMSKVPIFARFDFTEMLMLTASVAVIAAITFVF
jgi:hypothetical protein